MEHLRVRCLLYLRWIIYTKEASRQASPYLQYLDDLEETEEALLLPAGRTVSLVGPSFPLLQSFANCKSPLRALRGRTVALHLTSPPPPPLPGLCLYAMPPNMSSVNLDSAGAPDVVVIISLPQGIASYLPGLKAGLFG